MNASALLADLRRRGIQLSVAGERLSVDAPKGSVTPDLRNELTEHKSDLIRLLTEDDYEVAWRAAFMRPQVPPRGSVPFLVARPNLSDTRGVCLSCDGPLGQG